MSAKYDIVSMLALLLKNKARIKCPQGCHLSPLGCVHPHGRHRVQDLLHGPLVARPVLPRGLVHRPRRGADPGVVPVPEEEYGDRS